MDELFKTMPAEFKRGFIGVSAILTVLKYPSDLMARAQTYSQYKHHNTVKFLIGITPQWSVSFVSKGWGGRVSDKHLTEHCGILEHLSEGDVILADLGFTVQ